MGCECEGTVVVSWYEIKKKYAKAYAAAPKMGKFQILDQVVGAWTGSGITRDSC